MRRLLVSTTAWSIVWAIGMALWVSRGGKAGAGSWWMGMPLYLPTAVAIWGTVRGTYACRNSGAIAGSIIGLFWGAFIGAIGFGGFQCFFSLTDGFAFRNVPPWCTLEVVATISGIVIGVLVGFLIELAHIWDEHTALNKRRRELSTLSNDLASQLSFAEHYQQEDLDERIQKPGRPVHLDDATRHMNPRDYLG
jgi:hypothetical protein